MTVNANWIRCQRKPSLILGPLFASPAMPADGTISVRPGAFEAAIAPLLLGGTTAPVNWPSQAHPSIRRAERAPVK